jgi:hypothetical protein
MNLQLGPTSKLLFQMFDLSQKNKLHNSEMFVCLLLRNQRNSEMIFTILFSAFRACLIMIEEEYQKWSSEENFPIPDKPPFQIVRNTSTKPKEQNQQFEQSQTDGSQLEISLQKENKTLKAQNQRLQQALSQSEGVQNLLWKENDMLKQISHHLKPMSEYSNELKRALRSEQKEIFNLKHRIQLLQEKQSSQQHSRNSVPIHTETDQVNFFEKELEKVKQTLDSLQSKILILAEGLKHKNQKVIDNLKNKQRQKERLFFKTSCLMREIKKHHGPQILETVEILKHSKKHRPHSVK